MSADEVGAPRSARPGATTTSSFPHQDAEHPQRSEGGRRRAADPRRELGGDDGRRLGCYDRPTPRVPSTGRRFERFHSANPHIYGLLVDYCRQWAKAGHESFGIRAPWERMRWQLGIRTDATDYKLNDHFTSFYARLIVEQEPDLAALLSLRRSPEADGWIAARRVAVGEPFALFVAESGVRR